MVARKPSRYTSTTRPCNASLGEKAMEWTTKSSLPHPSRCARIPPPSGRAFHVERHDDRSFQLAGERLDVFLGLVIQIGDGQLGPERAESLGASPGDRIFVGNADNEASLAFEELGFRGGNHGRSPLAFGFGRCSCRKRSAAFEGTKGLASVLGVVDVCDLPAIDLQVALTPGRDVHFNLEAADSCHPFARCKFQFAHDCIGYRWCKSMLFEEHA